MAGFHHWPDVSQPISTAAQPLPSASSDPAKEILERLVLDEVLAHRIGDVLVDLVARRRRHHPVQPQHRQLTLGQDGGVMPVALLHLLGQDDEAVVVAVGRRAQ